MKNKDELKKAIERDINPKDYYNEIVDKIEESEKRNVKSNTWKYSLLPICLAMIIGGTIFLNYRIDKKAASKSNNYTNKIDNVTLNINEVDNKKGKIYRIDADVKVVTNDDDDFPLPYKNGQVNIPKDLDKTDKYIYYFRDKNKDCKDYNILGNYEVIYSNNDYRSINVKYSKDDKPIRDYYFSDEGSKTTKINGIELKIYRYENVYFTEFKFNDYYYDIETSNIDEQELSALLLSILR